MPWKINSGPGAVLGLGRILPGSRQVAGLLLRWLGFIFFWAFLALWFQMPGLIGPAGILPASDFLAAVHASFGFWRRLWVVPSLLWLGTGSAALHGLAAAGLAASVLVFFKIRPRIGLAVCLVCFLSFLSTAQVFASYQSDGMLMTAGLIGLFLDDARPSWWSLFALRWLWFTIYFGSGIAKLLSGDPEWRHLTALDQYYQNGPLPTWLGWYAQQHIPHPLAAATALAVLGLELGLAWLCFGPRRARILLFWIATPFQIAIILTANYGFLNYLVLGLGFALLDDRHLDWLLRRARSATETAIPASRAGAYASLGLVALFLVTASSLAHRVWARFPASAAVSDALEPFRVADPFGLFAVMTRERYEVEFQGSQDGETWTAYPFRFKPQDPKKAPGVYGPYQPRFDWNLWFASLGTYRENPWIEQTEIRLLQNDPAVLSLFAGNPFANAPPRAVRAVRWQYWFSTPAEKRSQGIWWTRRDLGLYAPELATTPQGIQVVQVP